MECCTLVLGRMPTLRSPQRTVFSMRWTRKLVNKFGPLKRMDSFTPRLRLEAARSISRHWRTRYMRSINFILYLILIVLMGACGAAPTENAVPMSTAEATLTPPTIISPTSMNSPVLEAGQWTRIFYHDGLEQVVMVNGGPEHGKPAEELLELWGWDGAQWSLISADTNGPTWRNWAGVAYDSGRDVLVIHGGIQGQNYFNETWEWDGQDWKLFTNTSARAKTLLFGGSDAGMEIHGST